MRKLLSIPLILLVSGVSCICCYSAILPGIYNSTSSHRLKQDELAKIACELRSLTGLTNLSFDSDGALIPGNQIDGGSEDARKLLLGSLSSGKRFEIENYPASPDIAFARISAGEDRVEAGKRITVFQLQLDLSDFKALQGDQRAVTAFGIGLNILHELTHGALGLMDPNNGAPVEGDCEKVINGIRQQLGLPQRVKYDPDLQVSQLSAGGRVVYASLTFSDSMGEKRKLSWLTTRVAANAGYASGRLGWRATSK